MGGLNRLRPRPSQLILFRGHAFAIMDLDGWIGYGTEGYYYRQTRFLSRMRIAIDGRQPQPVCAVVVDNRSSTAYYLAPNPAGSKAGPEPQKPDSSSEIVRHGIELQLNRRLRETLHDALRISNHALAPAALRISFDLAADFADRTEAQSGHRRQTAPVEREWQPSADGAVLTLSYRDPQLAHAAVIRFAGAKEWTLDGSLVSCPLLLPPGGSADLAVDITPVFRGQPIADDAAGAEESASDASECQPVPRLATANAVVKRAWDRAVADLQSLALLEGEGDDRLTPAAGVPDYVGLFGRDTLMTGLQAGLCAPTMLRGSLRLLAKTQGKKYDDRFDAQPGRIIHQRQQSPLALLEKTPFAHYYGDYSAPPLFLIALAWHLALTGDTEFFLSMQEPALATLEWMDRDADLNHDGFYEYETKAGDWGEKNQGWKDSGDAVLYPDGRMVDAPIALVEIQACFFAAKQLLALAFAAIGDEPRATRLLAEAEALKRRFNQAFWIAEKSYFALALDPAKQRVETIGSDPGQCLAYGIVEDGKARAIVNRLMTPELFSGWGLRTLSRSHPAFNPFAYHLGSVWPVSNALIGFGLKRYGFDAELHHLASSMFEASQLFEYDRLPEVFGGHQRDPRHPHPGIYPGQTRRRPGRPGPCRCWSSRCWDCCRWRRGGR